MDPSTVSSCKRKGIVLRKVYLAFLGPLRVSDERVNSNTFSASTADSITSWQLGGMGVTVAPHSRSVCCTLLS